MKIVENGWFGITKTMRIRETIGTLSRKYLHFIKSKEQTFNIDDVRIPYGTHTLKYPAHPQAETSRYGNGGKRKDVWTPHPYSI